MKVYLTEDQFLIAIGMSEAIITSVQHLKNKILLTATGIDVLFNFSQLEIHNPDISYDDWLRIKYIGTHTDRDDCKHVFVDSELEFIINDPYIFYEGNQNQFLELLGTISLYPIDDAKHKYIFGGTYLDSAHDEFEIQSNSPIELNIPESVVVHLSEFDLKDKFSKFDKAIEKAKQIQELKEKLKKGNNNQQVLLNV